LWHSFIGGFYAFRVRNGELVPQYAAYIKDPEVCDALRMIIGFSFALAVLHALSVSFINAPTSLERPPNPVAVEERQKN
jgi:hypothetical protein